MNCSGARPLLAEVLYGEATESTRLAVQTHLASCPECARQGNEMREACRSLAILTEATPTASVSALQLLQANVARAERSRRRRRMAGSALAALVAVILIAVGLQLRLELYRTHLVLGWGAPPAIITPAPPPSDPAVSELQTALKGQDERLTRISDLLNLTAREVLAVDSRQAAELNRLRRELVELRRDHETRWRLLAGELLSRDTELTAVNHLRENAEP